MPDKKQLQRAYEAMGETLGYSKRGHEKNYALNLAKALISNDDVHRLADLKGFYHLADVRIDHSYSGFWDWYRDFRPSPLDEVVYTAYRAVLDDMNLNGRLNVRDFSGKGERLWEVLSEWAADTQTPLEEILIDYCRVNVRIAKGFKDGGLNIIYAPKSIMGEFGMRNWLGHIENLGGREKYLKPSKAAAKAAADSKIMLAAIQKIRQKHLDDLEVAEYDRIGRLLASKGVVETFKELKLG